MGVLLRSSSNDEGPGRVWMALLEQHSPYIHKKFKVLIFIYQHKNKPVIYYLLEQIPDCSQITGIHAEEEFLTWQVVLMRFLSCQNDFCLS